MKAGIKISLWLVIVVLAYLVFNSISGKIAFEDETKRRREVVIERLKDIRIAQLAYKSVNAKYAKNFDVLMDFVKNDSFPVIKALGTVPDTLTEEAAVEMGLVTRDTAFLSVKDSIFSGGYLKDHKVAFYIDSLPFIPFGAGSLFDIDAGQVEKGKVKVQVFEVFARFLHIYMGLDTDNESIDLEDGLRVGSMNEPSTSGNWGE
jgi:hypothetical protein